MEFDATGIEPSTGGQSKVLPKGWYDFEIITYTTNDGTKTYPMEGFTKEAKYPKVDLLLQVINNTQYQDVRVFHTVTFMPKEKDGSGMAIHFLKTIGEPYEGKLDIDSQDWIGKKLQGFAVTDEYKGKVKNKLGEIKPIGEGEQKEKSDDIPF